jgi:GT2 family glycosyltransferase
VTSPEGPSVSILIPCHNAERWLEQAIASALAQTHPPAEIIVVDDGSTDRSAAIAASFAPRVALIRTTRCGGGAARNRLLEASNGEWLQYLDADDYLLPEKIERQMRTAEELRADVVYSPVIIRDEASGAETLYEGASGDALLDFVRWGPFQTSAMLWRRQALLEVSGWKADQPVCQEHELILRLIQSGARFAYCPSASTVYRRHASPSVSRRDPLETIRTRMALTDDFERWLASRGLLNRELRRELFIARMESARSAFALDSGFARRLSRAALRTGCFFRVRSAALPLRYRLALVLMGFEAAERLARLRRSRLVASQRLTA